MVWKSELEQQIRALQEENDHLRYKLTEDPREAIWLKIKALAYTTGEYMINDVAWGASSVVRDGTISREAMINYLLGPEGKEEE